MKLTEALISIMKKTTDTAWSWFEPMTPGSDYSEIKVSKALHCPDCGEGLEGPTTSGEVDHDYTTNDTITFNGRVHCVWCDWQGAYEYQVPIIPTRIYEWDRMKLMIEIDCDDPSFHTLIKHPQAISKGGGEHFSIPYAVLSRQLYDYAPDVNDPQFSKIGERVRAAVQKKKLEQHDSEEEEE